MIRLKLYLVGILLLFVKLHAYSQAPSELSLSRAWELTLANYPLFAEDQAQIKAASYQKQLIQHQFLPQLQLQLQNTYGSYAGSIGSFFPLPGIFNVSASPAELTGSPHAMTNLYGSLLMDWEIYAFGRRGKQLEAASIQEQAYKSRYHASQIKVRSEISSRYLDILYNQVNVEWAHRNADRMQEILALAKSLAEAGLKPGADTLFALSAYQQAVGEGENWQGKAFESRTALSEFMAFPTDTLSFSTTSYLTPTEANLFTAPDSVSNHPYLITLQHEVSRAHVQRQLTRRNLFPSLSLLGGISTRGSGYSAGGIGEQWSAGFGNRADNYLVGIGLTWNLTSVYNNRLENKLAEQNTHISQSRYKTQALKLHTTLRAIEKRLSEQQKQLISTKSAVHSARQAYALYMTRYESGLISMTELLQLQLLLQQAERSEIEAFHQFWNQVILKAEFTGDFSYLSTHF
ncbi:TolC family protein [Rhodocytophaga aerolata]|uniref:TolC family protein n=1 Tax=Rhodocytophaga aerolata TaxID=455078 RepID=A0ABT8RAZ4_9BACT|nr:TolC family protein [Rhodocytophaga aerolata]MDO1449271.1 TolC family protein [Rhodocytophaga aerolata]